MESSKINHYVFKYALLVFSVVLGIGAFFSWVDPESITVNGEPGSRDIITTSILGLLSLIFLLVFILIRDRFATVELRGQTIKIDHNGEEIIVSWLDIEEISLIPFVSPPLYKLKTKDSEQSIWFNTTSSYVRFGDHVKDLSDMGSLIEKKKRELGI